MSFISAEMIPIIIAMIGIVPMTHEVIRDVLENTMDFDEILNKSFLRVLEVIIAFMIFPTALVFLILRVVFLVMSVCLTTSFNIVNCLSQTKIIQPVCYYACVVLVFLSLNVAIILVLKFIHAALMTAPAPA